MDIKILEREEDKVRMVLKGEGHTFMNALVEELLTDASVDVAKYTILFQFSEPELFVTTINGKDPIVAIQEACARLTTYCDELLEEVRAQSTA
ncbi:DNA-directed RNA polymerase subunit L [Methanofollis formosanus]|uniref:DNA-directed RNA polymerase subunit Rpo11 n=1 Tax=Methanofollis formosanus TaxID=299308 RepID=A0A8G1EG58_9EURY|nr:DNA-directed RNA polymerase subunit L [Methanofollis formosanus]QYZ79440.1 DNA-directed RNA polymerase subunit L [Methanofollis formosanus]